MTSFTISPPVANQSDSDFGTRSRS